MANQRLKDALDKARVTPAELALYTESDVKTVHRWIGGRVPHPRTRFRIAKRLREDEDYLWPDARKASSSAPDDTGLVQLYPNRASVPPQLWDRMLDRAKKEIGFLVYVGMFLTEKPDLLTNLRTKAASGVRVRILIGDPSCDAVKQRSEDEGIGRDTIAAKILHATAFFQPLGGVPNIEIRAHQTVLYNSIYRFDDDMIVNPHVFGKTAPMAPALHVHRTAGTDVFGTYAHSFEAVWNAGTHVA
jgi:hypothetical protein